MINHAQKDTQLKSLSLNWCIKSKIIASMQMCWSTIVHDSAM